MRYTMFVKSSFFVIFITILNNIQIKIFKTPLFRAQSHMNLSYKIRKKLLVLNFLHKNLIFTILYFINYNYIKPCIP